MSARLSNLDILMMIYKNWPDDAQTNCELASGDVDDFFSKESDLLDDFEEDLEEAGYFSDQM